VLAALSPELGEALVRLGYSEPCELRRLPAVRTLAALRRSSQWRRRAGLVTADVPLDMWRELCWRYVVFPARVGDREAEIVFAVHMRPHRPPIHAALVDAATGGVLAWPAAPGRQEMLRRIAFPVHAADPAHRGYPAGIPYPADPVRPASPAERARPAASVRGRKFTAGRATAPGWVLAAPTDPSGAAHPPAHPVPITPATPAVPAAPHALLDDLPFSSDL
jgi:hypothetical protein